MPGYRVVGINPLPEEAALNLGVYFVSEFIVLSIGGALLVVEYNRNEKQNAIKTAKAAKAEAEFRQSLEDKFNEFDEKLAALHKKVQKIEKQLSYKEIIDKVFKTIFKPSL